MRLKLIVHLVRKETLEREYERLPYEPLTQDVLGVPVLKVVIQVVAGRNIAVLVEAAVRNTILQLRGIDTLPNSSSATAAPWNAQNCEPAAPQGAGPPVVIFSALRAVAGVQRHGVVLPPALGLGNGVLALFNSGS